MVVTKISASDFLTETKRWGITKDSLIRVRMMKKGKFIFFRFAVPRTDEILQTAIPIDQYREFDFINLSPISVPAIWTDEVDQNNEIIKKLEELNANTNTPQLISNQGIWKG